MSESRRNRARPAPARWPELRALLAWIAGSWRRPAGSTAGWEQAAGHERRSARPVAPRAPGAPPDPGAKNKAGGSQSSPPR